MSVPPYVSVLLPFRNAEATIDAAITSIVRQSFNDLELLLIDNGSRDGSSTIVHDWSGRDARILVLDEPKVGIAHALNAGLAAANGKYIARMDADDIAHRERLAKQVTYLDAHPEIGVLGTQTTFATTVQNSAGMRAFVEWQNKLISPQDHFLKRFVDAPLAHPTVMLRRELIATYGSYSTDPLPEDHELWLRWMDKGVKFAKLPEELLQWTDHPQRLSRTHANYSVEAFYRTKMHWLARWLQGTVRGRPVVVAGTSALCTERTRMLEAEGITVIGFTDVKRRDVPGYAFIPHLELPSPGEVFIVSFISQRGTGDRIAEFLTSRGLTEGGDFILAA